MIPCSTELSDGCRLQSLHHFEGGDICLTLMAKESLGKREDEEGGKERGIVYLVASAAGIKSAFCSNNTRVEKASADTLYFHAFLLQLFNQLGFFHLPLV